MIHTILPYLLAAFLAALYARAVYRLTKARRVAAFWRSAALKGALAAGAAGLFLGLRLARPGKPSEAGGEL